MPEKLEKKQALSAAKDLHLFLFFGSHIGYLDVIILGFIPALRKVRKSSTLTKKCGSKSTNMRIQQLNSAVRCYTSALRD